MQAQLFAQQAATQAARTAADENAFRADNIAREAQAFAAKQGLQERQRALAPNAEALFAAAAAERLREESAALSLQQSAELEASFRHAERVEKEAMMRINQQGAALEATRFRLSRPLIRPGLRQKLPKMRHPADSSMHRPRP